MNARHTEPVQTGDPLPVPNHHASHPGFSGVSGLFAGIGFLFGRDNAARLAIDLAELRSSDRLVDVGCGPGIAVQRAKALGAEAIGIDPSSAMLRVARARWRSDPRVDWRIGTAESLPVDDAWATVWWSLSTVHHWADVEGGLSEARRVLAPGGRLVALERRIEDMRGLGVDLARLRESIAPTEPASEFAVADPQPEQQELAPTMRPRCPNCYAELDGNLVETVVVARRDDGTTTDVRVAFCLACGATLGALRAEQT